MPQLFAIALVGAACYTGYRMLARLSAQMSADLKRAQDELKRRAAAAAGDASEKDLGVLEFDPKSGVYKPTVAQPSDRI
jgi:hypothetical protein